MYERRIPNVPLKRFDEFRTSSVAAFLKVKFQRHVAVDRIRACDKEKKKKGRRKERMKEKRKKEK